MIEARTGESIEDDQNLSGNEAKRSRRVAMAVFIGLTCVFLGSVFYQPSRVDSNGSYFTLCGFKALTGLPCPGCGLTHSFCAIGKGDLREAFAFNAIGPALYVVAILVWLRFLFELAAMKPPVEFFDRHFNHIMAIRVFAIGLGLFGIARIVYIIVWSPAGIQNSPLIRLMQRLLA